MTVTSPRRVPSASVPEPERAPDRHPWRRRVLLLGLFLGLTALMLRPSWHSLDRTVPDLGDPVLYIWALSWGGHAIFTQPLHLFSANIFWPHPLTFAYTDNLLALVAPFGLVRLLGGSWALALNLTMIGLFVGSQASTYLLAHWLTGRRDAAVLAAIAFTFSSFIFVHFGHTQLLLFGLFPLCFYLLFRTLEERSIGWAALLGVANVAMLTGALYYAVIYGVCVTIIVGGWLYLHRRDLSRRLLHCLVVVGAITLLAVPTLVPYARLNQERTIGPRSGLRATDLITVSPGSVLYPALDHAAAKRGGRTEHTYFPGFSTALLALVGLGALAASRRRRHRELAAPDRSSSNPDGVVETRARDWPDDPVVAGRRQYVWLLIAAAAASFVLALGPQVFGITMPFQWFHDYLPGFKNIRAIPRLVMPAMLTGALLASIGFCWLTRRLRVTTAAAIAVAVGAFMLLEFAAPVHRIVLPTDQATLAVYHELARRPQGAVAELPIAGHNSAFHEWPFVEAPRMVYGTIDFHNRVNGYSGSAPDDYLTNLASLNSFPSRGALDTARRLKVRFIVLHLGRFDGYLQYTNAQAQAVVAALPRNATAKRYGNSWLIDLGGHRT
jgi:MYXO-CTERM domain-containing protein